MNHTTDRTTGKMTIEAHPDLVDAITEAIQQRLSDQLTVTYISKDQHIPLNGHVRRTLRLKKNEE
jgi:hypothetical protein